MSTVKKISVTIRVVLLESPKNLIRGVLDTGRKVYFYSARKDLRVGQKVQLTYHTLKQDGLLEKARFKGWLNSDLVAPKEVVKPGPKPKVEKTFTTADSMVATLQEFSAKMLRKKGHIYLEDYKVELTRKRWFRVYLRGGRVVSAPFATDIVRYIEADRKQKEDSDAGIR